MARASRPALLLGILALALLSALSGCGNSSVSGEFNPPLATVRVSISDPPTCEAPKGPYRNVWVTIVGVRIHKSADAENTAAGWIDLAPQLATAPMQLDLLAQGDNACFLAQLGTTQLEAGNYQQIRLILAPNNTSLSIPNNQCGNAANCVVLDADGSVHTLQLSSQAQTGIKIPPGQIAGGGVSLEAGQTSDLNIDFNACASIVVAGNGQFRLNPTLHAGEVSTTSSSIAGKVVDSVTTQAITGGNTVVALEQKDTDGVDRVIMSTVANADGSFNFCPVPAGTYDLVVAAVDGAGVAYAATVVSGVQPGNALGNLPIIAVTGTNTSPASITGNVSSAGTGGAVAVDVTLSALQSVTIGGSPVLVTVPLAQQSAATTTIPTAAGGSCAAGTACAAYTLGVPPANPNVGAFGTSITFTQDTTSPVNYTVDARTFKQGVDATPTCNPSKKQTNQTSAAAPLAVTPGTSVEAAALAFTDCT
jgi:hypothetical protein